MRISDWSSDVCSSDLLKPGVVHVERIEQTVLEEIVERLARRAFDHRSKQVKPHAIVPAGTGIGDQRNHRQPVRERGRSEEHKTELQSLMRNSYAVLCLETKKLRMKTTEINIIHKHMLKQLDT